MAEGIDSYIRRVLAGEAVEPRLPTDAAGLRRLRATLARRARVLQALRDAASGLAREGAQVGTGAPAPRLDRRA